MLFLGDTTLTGGQMADKISQYIQAFEALGAGTGTAVGLLALNRPEVLLIIGAGQTQGYRRTALHPLGSLDDHAYVLADAGVTSLIIDPNPMFVERALGLLDRVDSLKQILTIGPVPEALARRQGPVGRGGPLPAGAAGRRGPAARPHRRTDLHRRHHRQAQGRDGHRAVDHHHDDHPASRVGVAGQPEVPDVHPAVARRGGVLHPDADQGRPDVRAGQVRSGRVLKTIEEQRITATMLVPSMLYALMDHPDSRTRDLSSLETVYYGASAINPVRWPRRSSGSDRSSPSTTGSPRRRW